MELLTKCFSLMIIITMVSVSLSQAEVNPHWGEIMLKPISAVSSRYSLLSRNIKYVHSDAPVTAGKAISRVMIRDDCIIVVENDDRHRDIVSIYDLEGNLIDVYDIILKEDLADTYHYIEYEQHHLLLLNGKTGYECIYCFHGDRVDIYQMDYYMEDYRIASEKINATASPYQIVSIKKAKVEIRRPDGTTFIIVDNSEKYNRVSSETKRMSTQNLLFGLIVLAVSGIITEIIVRQKEREGD